MLSALVCRIVQKMRNLSNHSEREKSKSMNKRFGKKAVQWMVNANLLIIHQDVAKKAALEKKLLMGEEWRNIKKEESTNDVTSFCMHSDTDGK